MIESYFKTRSKSLPEREGAFVLIHIFYEKN